MSYYAELTLAEFKSLVEDHLEDKGDNDDYQKAVARVARKARNFAASLHSSENPDNVWSEWTASISSLGDLSEDDKARVHKFNDNTVRDLSQCKASLIHAFAFHYRSHQFHTLSDLKFADQIDEVIFNAPLRHLKISIFSHEPDEYIFPQPSAPFSYPPYVTSKQVKKLISKRPDHGIWLSPHNHYSIPLKHRTEEISRLTSFLEKKGQFRILPVVGPSGVGKSRLVSQWMKDFIPLNGKTTGWDAGILSTEISGFNRSHARDPRPWNQWTIQTNTLIAIDYTYAFADVAYSIFQAATNRNQNKQGFKVRIVLIDHVMPNLLSDDFFWRSAAGNRPGNLDLIQSQYLESEINLRANDDQFALLRHVISSSANLTHPIEKFSPDDEVVRDAVDHLHSIEKKDPRKGITLNPLFAALLGQIIREKGTSAVDFSGIKRRHLATYYFESPDRLPWEGWQGHPEEKQRTAHGARIGALVAAATIRRGLSAADAQRRLGLSHLEFASIKQRANRIVSSENQHSISPLTPDVIGEIFLLKFLEHADNDERALDELVSLICCEGAQNELDIAENFRATISRLSRNLANEDSSQVETVRSWDLLARFLDPIRFKSKKHIEIYVIYTISDTFEFCTDAFSRVRSKHDDHSQSEKDEIDYLIGAYKNIFEKLLDNYSAGKVEESGKTGNCQQALESLLKVFEHSDASGLHLEDSLVRTAARFARENGERLTPSMFAASQGKLSGLRVFIERMGDDINATISSGWSLMSFACAHGQMPIVEYLVENAAHVDQKTELGRTPIELAIDNGHLAVADYLHGAIGVSDSKSILSSDAMATAVVSGRRSDIELLLDRGFQIDALLTKEHTALMLAAREGHTEIVEFLLHRSADPSIEVLDTSALSLASLNGNRLVVEALLEHNANVDPSRSGAWSPIKLASREGHKEIVQILVEHGATLENEHTEVSDNSLSRPSNFYDPVSKFAYGDLDCHNPSGWTPLMIACLSGRLQVVDYLLQMDLNLDARNPDGWSPLMLASFMGHLQVVDRIIRAADARNTVIDSIEEAIQFASWNGNIKVRLALERAYEK